ncbi:MAG: DNA-binding response regulator [Schwartzia sp. (in: firmicutes)]
MTAKKILLVEDDPGIAEVEADYLTANGFDVEIAQDGRQGKEKALHDDYDLLLLDIMLPVNRIREKIEPNPGKPRYIETVWGAGYRFRGK